MNSYLKLALVAAAGGAIVYVYIKRTCPCKDHDAPATSSRPASTLGPKNSGPLPPYPSDDKDDDTGGAMTAPGCTSCSSASSSASSPPDLLTAPLLPVTNPIIDLVPSDRYALASRAVR